MNDRERIILDVDTGVDDALAILFAVKSPKLRVEGITTGFGNVDVWQATENTLRVLELADPRYSIPVAIGANQPLFRPMREPSAVIHGKNGLGDYELPPAKQAAIQDSAVDFLISKVNEYPQQITLVFTGRLTNLAIALAKDPSISKKVKRLVLMGGALKVPGNITPVAEANIHGDPEAAHRVFESNMPITMVGLDVTSKTKFGRAHFSELMQQLSQEKAELRSFLQHIFEYSFEASESLNEGAFRLMHDPLAVGVVENNQIVSTEDYYIYIETRGALSSGATLADFRWPQSKTNAAVCMDVQHEVFLQHYIDIVAS